MCGIAGVYTNDGRKACPSTLLAMAGELLHRGPDGVGLYLDGSFGMVNTRLSIIDLAGGDQPLGNENGRYWVMQNGEIYNYPELTRDLEGRGHVFSTKCDTEVLVHAYEEWGVDCLRELNGEFAFAIWDRKERELFLARDRFGIRPLYISQEGEAFSFASEIKALLRHPKAKRELDPVGLVDVFTAWTTLPDTSCFSGVRELAPGHYLLLTADGSKRERRWWDVPFTVPGAAASGTADSLAEEVAATLEDATRVRLRADVPVGVYLSGGLDSSITAALAKRHVSDRLTGFGVGFSDPRFDEGIHQERMATELGVDLLRVEVRPEDIAEAFPRVVRLAECPMLRTAPAPLLRLSELSRRAGFKVVLTGEGADELFAGYNIFRETMVRRLWARQPDSKWRPKLLTKLYPYLSTGLNESGQFLESFFGWGLQKIDDPLYSHQIRFRNTARCLRLLNPEIVDKALRRGPLHERLVARLPSWFMSMGPLSRAQYLEIHTFMQGYLLHAQGDRMLMGSSVEGRFPFLDHRVASLAASIPERLRLRGMREKHILRKAFRTLLPPDVLSREKRPYRAPILNAFVGPSAPDYVRELLSPEQIEKVGLFSKIGVATLFEKCRRASSTGVGEVDEMALVGVISTMLLHRDLVEHRTFAPAPNPGRVVEGDRVVTSAFAPDVVAS